MLPELKILFVCSKNQWRSPTAEEIYRDHPRLIVRSRGTSPKARRSLTAQDLDWADLVMVMEYKHKKRIRSQHPQQNRDSRFYVLEIEDRFHAMDPRLVAELRQAIDPILDDNLSR